MGRLLLPGLLLLLLLFQVRLCSNVITPMANLKGAQHLPRHCRLGWRFSAEAGAQAGAGVVWQVTWQVTWQVMWPRIRLRCFSWLHSSAELQWVGVQSLDIVFIVGAAAVLLALDLCQAQKTRLRLLRSPKRPQALQVLAASSPVPLTHIVLDARRQQLHRPDAKRLARTQRPWARQHPLAPRKPWLKKVVECDSPRLVVVGCHHRRCVFSLLKLGK